jgi:hypothetical protein
LEEPYTEIGAGDASSAVAREDKIGADPDHPYPSLSRQHRDVFRSHPIDPVGEAGVTLAAIDIGIRRAVDDHVRASLRDCVRDLAGITNVPDQIDTGTRIPAQADDLMTSLHQALSQIHAQLTACPGDQYSLGHQTNPTWA